MQHEQGPLSLWYVLFLLYLMQQETKKINQAWDEVGHGDYRLENGMSQVDSISFIQLC